MEKGNIKIGPVALVPWKPYTDLQLEKNYGATISSFQNVGDGCEVCCIKYKFNAGTSVGSSEKEAAYFMESTPILDEVNGNAKRRGLESKALILYGGDMIE